MSNGLMMLAILPGILIIIYIYRMDKVEKEPWGLILKLMIFGALSCIPASFMEAYIESSVSIPPEGTLGYAVTNAFLVAALCEEICKYFFLRVGAWNHREFGYRFDGIVYGVSVAVGFAVLENILYVTQYGFYTALIRAVMAVPLHAFCGVFMGIFFGAAKQAQIQGRSTIKFKLLALIVPMLIHGVYDSLAFMSTTPTSIILLAFVLLMYIVSIRVIRQFSRDDWKAGFYPDTQPLSDGGFGPQAGGFGSQAGGFGSQGGPGPNSGFGGNRGNVHTTADGFRAYPGDIQDGKIIMLCPYCKRGMRVPVGLGKVRVRCPHCGKEFEEIS